MKIYKPAVEGIISEIVNLGSFAAYLVLIAERTTPALNRLHDSIRPDGLDSGFRLNIQALTGPVLNGNVQVVSDEEVLSGSVVDAWVNPDGAAVGGIISEVDAANLTRGGVDDLNLGSANVVVEELDISRARTALARTDVQAASALSINTSNEPAGVLCF